MTLPTLSVIQQIPQEIKYRYIISRSTSNNISQAQEFNIPDLLVNSPSRDIQSSKQSFLSLLVWPSSFYSKAWRAKFPISPKVLKYSAVSRFLLVLQTRDLKFLNQSFFAKNVAKSPKLAKLSPKMSPSSSRY